MRLGVIGDMAHYRDSAGRLYALAPLVGQLEQWARFFDVVELCGVLHAGAPPPGFAPYRSGNFVLSPLRGGGGSTLRTKLGLVPLALHWWLRTRAVARRSDAVHLRCPCNVGLVALASTRGVVRLRYAHYAGVWREYANEPRSYRWQRRHLDQRFEGPVTVYDSHPDRPNLVPIFSPSLTASDLSALAPVIVGKLARVPATAPLRIVTVGRLSENKNQAAIIRAIGILRRRGIAVTLDVVGEGPLRTALEVLAREDGVADAVHFRGAVDHDAVLHQLADSDFNVLATHQEGYGKVLLEGMAAGAVPIFGDSPMAAEIAGDGRRGVVLGDLEPESIARSICDLVADPERWNGMILEGRDYSSRMTLEAFGDRIGCMLRQYWNLDTSQQEV